MKKSLTALIVFVGFATLVRAGAIDSEMEKILDQYFKIQAALAQDSTKGVDAAAGEIVAITAATRTSDQKTAQLLVEIKKTARQIQGKKLDQVRGQFDALSKPILQYFKDSYAGKKEHHGYYCSMEKKSWIQAEKEIRNPYFGSAMLKCGEPIR